jgi:hypothetical protein
MRCQLPQVDDEDLHQGVESLIRKCEKTHCTFWQSDLDSDRLPANCILLVVAMLDKRAKS